MRRAVKLAVFDVDGTLIDSRVVIHQAMARAFERAGLGEIAYDRVRTIVGLELTEAVLRLAPPDYPAERIPELARFFKEAFAENRTRYGEAETLYSGAIETLEALLDTGWRLAVATGKSAESLNLAFARHGLHRYFESLHTTDGGPGKPHPRMVFEAMAAINAHPEETVMVGDTSFDMAMARAALAGAAGVSWGFHTVEEIAAGGAHAIYDDFPRLHKGLAAIFG